MREQLYLYNKSLKLDIFKWIAILSIKGLTLAAVNFKCITICNPFNSNPKQTYNIKYY